MTPVVVSSVPATTPGSSSRRFVMQHVDQVSAVVHGEMRFVVQRGVDVLVVGDVVFTLDGVDRDLIMSRPVKRPPHPGSKGDWTRSAPRPLRPPAASSSGWRSRWSRAGTRKCASLSAAVRLAEAFFNLAQHRHLAFCPVDLRVGRHRPGSYLLHRSSASFLQLL